MATDDTPAPSKRRRHRDLGQWETDPQARRQLRRMRPVPVDATPPAADRSVRAASAGLPGLGRRR
jgi:hypothetical protein